MVGTHRVSAGTVGCQGKRMGLAHQENFMGAEASSGRARDEEGDVPDQADEAL